MLITLNQASLSLGYYLLKKIRPKTNLFSLQTSTFSHQSSEVKRVTKMRGLGICVYLQTSYGCSKGLRCPCPFFLRKKTSKHIPNIQGPTLNAQNTTQSFEIQLELSASKVRDPTLNVRPDNKFLKSPRSHSLPPKNQLQHP